jgi:hypothetical protein
MTAHISTALSDVAANVGRPCEPRQSKPDKEQRQTDFHKSWQGVSVYAKPEGKYLIYRHLS